MDDLVVVERIDNVLLREDPFDLVKRNRTLPKVPVHIDVRERRLLVHSCVVDVAVKVALVAD